ncbi:MAG: family 16 glycoside hydrolase [Betaproteobacteria bacterium]
MNRIASFALLSAFALSAAAETVNFDTHPVGATPADWTCAAHGNARGPGNPVWKVEADAKAPSAPNVLLQSGSSAYAYCIKNGVSMADGTLEVRFKPIFGENAQAGGLVFRFKDQDNYYVARPNANESNINLYYFDKGKRMSAKEVSTPTIALNEWHTLKVVFKGKHIEAALDGKTLIDVEDDHITGAGGIGVWTRFDSKTAFDDFKY